MIPAAGLLQVWLVKMPEAILAALVGQLYLLIQPFIRVVAVVVHPVILTVAVVTAVTARLVAAGVVPEATARLVLVEMGLL